MKISKKLISETIAKTPSCLDKQSIRGMESVYLGCWQRSDANWCWELHAISYEGHPMLVASAFGRIAAEGK